MATIDDIGTPGAPLSTPPLTGWQAAVRDALKPAGDIGARRLGHALQTVGQTGIGTTTVLCTGLTATVTVPAGHVIRVTARIVFMQATGSGAHQYIYLTDNGATVQVTLDYSATSGEYHARHAQALLVGPPAGSHTYAASVNTSAGTMNTIAGATSPNFLIVETLGKI